MLADHHIDALTELINVSIGVAANSLSEILESHVTLTVPSLSVFDSTNTDSLYQSMGTDQTYAMVKQDFNGNLSGTTALAFPPESAAKLVSLISDVDIHEDELQTMHTSTVLEIGNIINNAFLGTLNNQFNFHVDYSLPEYDEIDVSKLLGYTYGEDEGGVIILANAQFIIKSNDIRGHILLLFKVIDVEFLRRKLDDIISG